MLEARRTPDQPFGTAFRTQTILIGAFLLTLRAKMYELRTHFFLWQGFFGISLLTLQWLLYNSGRVWLSWQFTLAPPLRRGRDAQPVNNDFTDEE